MESGDQRRISHFRDTLRSLATRIPRISVHHVDSVFPALRQFSVSSLFFLLNIQSVITNILNNFITKSNKLTSVLIKVDVV